MHKNPHWQELAEKALAASGIGPAYSIRVLSECCTEEIVSFALIHDRGAEYKKGPRRVYIERKIPVELFTDYKVLPPFLVLSLFVLHKINS